MESDLNHNMVAQRKGGVCLGQGGCDPCMARGHATSAYTDRQSQGDSLFLGQFNNQAESDLGNHRYMEFDTTRERILQYSIT